MTSMKIRKILLWIWLAFFLMDISVFLVLFFQKYIEWVDLKPALEAVNGIFAPYLGAILLYFFNSKKDEQVKGESSTSGILAIVSSGIWNILIFIFLAPLLWLEGTVEDSLTIIQNLSNIFAWLIAGALGYYFAKDQR